MQNRALNLALEREKQKAAGLSAELQKTKLMETVPQAGTTDPQAIPPDLNMHASICNTGTSRIR